MTGYQEILTDPSYCRQIVTLTYPHIGNTGANPEDLESAAIYAAGLVIRDLPLLASSWRAAESLPTFLQRGKLVAIAEIDTRKLTRILRDKGAQAGCIMTGEQIEESAAVRAARKFPGLKGMDLAKVVTTKRQYQWNEGSLWREDQRPLPRPAARLHVVAYDFGIKRNILRLLADYGCRMTVVPATTPAEQVLALNPDGIFLSNGPGDPEPCDYAIGAIQAIPRDRYPDLRHLPGSPAAGTRQRRTHHQDEVRPSRRQSPGAGARQRARVHHQPEPRLRRGRERRLPPVLQADVPFAVRRLAAGLARIDRPAFSFQGHPEASPGPHDLRPLFEQFLYLMVKRLQNLSRSLKVQQAAQRQAAET